MSTVHHSDATEVQREDEEAFRFVKTADALGLEEWLEDRRCDFEDDVAFSGFLSRLRDGSHKDSTLLHWASYLGSIDLVDMLLAAGASVGVKERDGKTPLHWAAFEGHLKVMQALMKPPPLSAAATQTDTGGVSPLVMRDVLGHTPCHLAVMNEHREAARLCPNFDEVQRGSTVSPMRSLSRDYEASVRRRSSPSRPRTPTPLTTSSQDAGTSPIPAVASEATETLPFSVEGEGAATTDTSTGSGGGHRTIQSAAVSTPTRSSRWDGKRTSKGKASKPLHVISPRTSAPPSISQLKRQAEMEEVEGSLATRSVRSGSRADSQDLQVGDETESTPPLEPVPETMAPIPHDGTPNRGAQPTRGGQPSYHGEEEQVSYGYEDEDRSPHGVAVPQQEPFDTTLSYDEPAEEPEEEALRQQEDKVARRLERMRHRREKQHRREVRAQQMEQLRQTMRLYANELVEDGEQLPTELVHMLEDTGCIERPKINWVGGGNARSHNYSSSSRAQSARSGYAASDYSRGYSEASGPQPSSAIPQPYPYQRSASGSIGTHQSQNYSQVRVPSTRFPPTTPVWIPRTGSSTRSRSKDPSSRQGKTWKPPTSVVSEPLGLPSHHIAEKMKTPRGTTASASTPHRPTSTIIDGGAPSAVSPAPI